MCGISIAINNQNEPVTQEQIKAMNGKVIHRGPDDEGFFFGDNFSFGHRRLSILDLSMGGHQPMHRKHLTITYNGEIFNYIELRNELTALGHSFHTGTDTEVILAAYQQWSTAAFDFFNGMWAFAIYDLVNNEIILCRDRYGIKPLYFTQVNSLLLAGSEIKQFLAFKEFLPVLNKKVAVNFLLEGLLNYSTETFFEGVNELRPGHFLKYNLLSHQYTITKWYDLDKSSKPVNDDYDTAVQQVRELFINSVYLRMRSDVRVGSCLSGGIDSSSIVCTVAENKLANNDFATITSCYEDKSYDEQTFSDEVSRVTGINSLKVFPNLDRLLTGKGELDTIVYHQDQPIRSASHYSEFSVFKKAGEQRIIVMLDGQGSDEYLCGYSEFFTIRMKELIKQFKPKAAFSLLKLKAEHNGNTFFRQLNSFIKTAYLFRIQAFIKKITGWNMYPHLSSEWKAIAKKHAVNFTYAGNTREQSIMEMEFTSIPYQLHSEDRNSMLFSIESRLPFLDHRLVEYVIGLPSDYKIRSGYTKAVLRDAMMELPHLVKYRKDKMGFVAPDLKWIVQNKEYVRSNLKEIVDNTCIFSDELLQRFDRFIKGDLGYEHIYFRVMAFNRFCKIFGIVIK